MHYVPLCFFACFHISGEPRFYHAVVLLFKLKTSRSIEKAIDAIARDQYADRLSRVISVGSTSVASAERFSDVRLMPAIIGFLLSFYWRVGRSGH